jgi:hypothetical protein
MTISPGDSIFASVTFNATGSNAGQFQLTLVDVSRSNDLYTTSQTSSGTQNPLALRNCAEWIVEAPTNAKTGTIDPLANFGSVSFTNATATVNGVSGAIDNGAWQCARVNMIGTGGGVEASPSALTDATGTAGSSFAVSCSAASSAPVTGSPAAGTQLSINQMMIENAASAPVPSAINVDFVAANGGLGALDEFGLFS